MKRVFQHSSNARAQRVQLAACTRAAALDRASGARAHRHCDEMLNEYADDDCTVVHKHIVRTTMVVAMICFLLNQTHTIESNRRVPADKVQCIRALSDWCIRYHIIIETVIAMSSRFNYTGPIERNMW